MGLAHAHACNYSHGDIKSPNILITRAFIAKIADFGMSAFWKREKGGRSAWVDPSAPSSGMSVMWAAPELFTSRQATFATDVYAFGVVLWEIATCMAPYGMDVATTAIPTIVQSGGRPDMRMLDAHPLRAQLIPKAGQAYQSSNTRAFEIFDFSTLYTRVCRVPHAHQRGPQLSP